MAKAGRGADQFMVRLPPGMRERIAGAAERNYTSMNTEVVKALELAFPEPVDLNTRLRDLLNLLQAFKIVRGQEGAIDSITVEIRETMEAIASGRVPEIDEVTKENVSQTLREFELKGSEREAERRREIQERHASTRSEDIDVGS